MQNAKCRIKVSAKPTDYKNVSFRAKSRNLRKMRPFGSAQGDRLIQNAKCKAQNEGVCDAIYK